MIYRHRFEVQAPRHIVAAFHRQSASMGAITPPPVIVKVHSAPELLANGDEMKFTLWLGPVPIHWHARIDAVSEAGFIDRQLHGPFRIWEHHHRFEQIDETTTAVIDEVTAELSSNPFWKIVGGSMWLSLPILFAFRGWKTRRLLQETVADTQYAQ